MGTYALSDPSHPDHEAWHRDHVLDGLPHTPLIGPAVGDLPEPTPPSRCPALSDPSHPDHLAWQAEHTSGQVAVVTEADADETAARQAEVDKPKRRAAAKRAPAKKAAARKKAAPRKAAAKKAR